MKILIVDDEQPARERIKNLLKKSKNHLQTEEAENGQEAIAILQKYKPDILYLDIKLNNMNGFEVLNEIQESKMPIIIFVSAFDDYALKAFEYEAFDFLLKPFKEERFFKSFSKASELALRGNTNDIEKQIEKYISIHEKQKNLSNLPVKIGNKTIFVPTKDIKYILADRSYAEIFTEKNKYILRQSLNHLSEILDSQNFCRIHRSTIININFIHEVIHSDYSEIDIKMNDHKLFRVSRSLKKDVFESLGL